MITTEVSRSCRILPDKINKPSGSSGVCPTQRPLEVADRSLCPWPRHWGAVAAWAVASAFWGLKPSMTRLLTCADAMESRLLLQMACVATSSRQHCGLDDAWSMRLPCV
jgi:hypothetical protein